MQQIVNFIIRFQAGLIFLLLASIAFFLTQKANTYHHAKVVSSTNAVSGWWYLKRSLVTDYFYLGTENERLVQENAWLREHLFSLDHTEDFPLDSLPFTQAFDIIPAKVISNSYRKTNNYLLLNKGLDEEITQDMAVISSQGIVGIIEDSNDHFARVISVLNTNISINASLKNSFHFGSLRWNSASPYYTQLLDIPRSAVVNVGDTIVTGGNSLIFPEGIPIGKINSYFLDDNVGYYQIEVELFNDMTSMGNVYVLKLINREEALELLEDVNE
jgi:rod shape-determining protein MreC